MQQMKRQGKDWVKNKETRNEKKSWKIKEKWPLKNEMWIARITAAKCFDPYIQNIMN